VRELHNVVEHVLTVATGATIRLADLPRPFSGPHRSAAKHNLVGLTMDEVERRAILETYEALGSVKSSAEILGRSPRTIHYRLKRYRDGATDLGSLRGLPRQESAPTRDPRVAQARLRILLADDDDDLRWALARVLSDDGHEVFEVSSGDALLEQLWQVVSSSEDASPFVVITDLRMPGLNGFQVLESVRRLGWGMPIVMMSAFGDDEIRKKASELGAAAFLDKPIDLPALHGALQGVVRA
jgi:DNA-binding NtrC family response regulator